MSRGIESLDLGRPCYTGETANGVSLENTHHVKERLLRELVELEKRMKSLEDQMLPEDYSMIQTYREMIHSRTMFFRELNR